ncbi:transporter substrate-binding domain-containing protein [Pseudomonas sp. NA-150]|uniref:transporter substrate-binding domain-containing protein n=1 Tax=Pseudomonas sp. NA-150 TaxID=3367525 RepID=UPI0037C579B4
MKSIVGVNSILSLATFVCLVGTVQAESLRIATEGAYPPFNYVDSDNQLRGFDVDIANAVCEKMHVHCTVIAQDWEGIIPALLAKKYDAIVASMSVTEERQKKVSFTDRYYRTSLVMAVPKDSDIHDSGIKSLAGKKIGVQASTAAGIYAQDVYGPAGADVKLYPNQDEANSDLINGRLDAIVNDKFPMIDWLNKSGASCCTSLGDISNTSGDIGIAVRKEDNSLRQRMNTALADLVADGTYKKIQSRYFSIDIN